MKLRHAVGVVAGAGFVAAVWFLARPVSPVAAEKPMPVFKIDAAGEVVCEDDADACVYSERVARPSGDWYLVQGSHTRKEYEAPNPQFHDEGLVTYPFAYIGKRDGDRLIPFHNFLEDGEKLATLETADLNKDGVPEVIVTASMGLNRSYVKVFGVLGEAPQMIFEARSETSFALFENLDPTYRISVEVADRPKAEGRKPSRFHRQVFEWDGKAFGLAG